MYHQQIFHIESKNSIVGSQFVHAVQYKVCKQLKELNGCPYVSFRLLKMSDIGINNIKVASHPHPLRS